MPSKAKSVSNSNSAHAAPRPRPAGRWVRLPPPPLSFEAMRVAVKLGDAGVSVREVAMRFPHVLNRVADAWGDPAAVTEVMADLMVDRRGGRCGFPPAALEELNALSKVCAECRNKNADRLLLR
jgi:hypothetical protein